MEESRLWGSYLGWVHCKSPNLLQPSLGESTYQKSDVIDGHSTLKSRDIHLKTVEGIVRLIIVEGISLKTVLTHIVWTIIIHTIFYFLCDKNILHCVWLYQISKRPYSLQKDPPSNNTRNSSDILKEICYIIWSNKTILKPEFLKNI
jgi:hypothetical protein